ncbi:type IV conjugative transfer system protein TraE [Klebsiella aerogenes]|uniref:type IV conjugative transfer system protein TraE n=1 Tax=Klebsiella aerogenes TaxID=548 RepID=UPI000DA162ED|nr:type IV conjugative transfer system protein TraE [Klebsiella aerogenes]HCB2859851.1 type IV conjugative transfer system protein TraE [Klebsiella aerogenes]HCB2864854.1 type IV conjugative transfer system protein TraE [Klebsiella aerogenes]HCB2880474.1 type IV conjugative transfer system protein TraE [Klebsiella aerogenes]HCB3345917.1 type IV conjugative transfer system protein TraE [Klebsiella aerogenes]HCM1811919.1 type IV conjugative transfer system protein TraE [Klebsiella aerogenes]
MKLKFKRKATRYTSLTFLVLIGLLGLSLGGNLVAWIRLSDLIDSREQTLIPMFFSSPVTLSRNHTDGNYLEQIAESLIYLRYNVSPENVKANHTALLRYFETDVRTQMKPVLDEEASRIQDSNVTSAFYMTKIDSWPASGIVDIHGTVRSWVGSREQPQEDKTLRLSLNYRQGLTTIKDFREMNDDKKHPQ